MHRFAAVACAQVTTVFIHFLTFSHNHGPIINIMCQLPTVIFLFGVTATLSVCQLIPTIFLPSLNPIYQFIVQYIASLLILNISLHGLWFNIETFITYILPRILDHLISENLDMLWYEIEESIWARLLSGLVATSLLAIITPFILNCKINRKNV
ncbi:hypothetical protein O3M35_005483 [Rhynocoris fuscipes]|uniref:Uncharacterized protein n=1 Tax=Rhynocoris fuscipes TaxID=488301 RepID=A0AAW1DIT9_9HEMI